MKKNNTDNTLFVLQRIIKKFRLKVADSTIAEFLQSHPNYPTLKSVCDTLTYLKIEHYALRFNSNEIKNMEIPFIAHLNDPGGQLAYIEKIRDDEVVFYTQEGERQLEDFDVLEQRMSGAVILIEPDQKIKESGYKEKSQMEVLEKSLLPISALVVVLISFYSYFLNKESGFNGRTILLEMLSLSILGIVVSILLVLQDFKIHTSIGDKLCGFNSKTDCDSVLSSDASVLFGNVKWSDIGLIYFIGTLIFLMGSTNLNALSLLALLSAASLPYPVFSLYYQVFKLKKWCPFCLVVQAILICEFLIVLPVFKNLVFTLPDFIRFLMAFMIPGVIWLLYKLNSEKTIDLKHKTKSYLELKRNPEIFRYLLKSNDRVEFYANNNDLILGRIDAPVTITAFLSLYCEPCAKAFKKLKLLIETCQEIRINAIISVYNDEESHAIINTLYYCFATKGQNAALEFLDKWYSISPHSRKSLYKNEIVPEKYWVAEKLGAVNKELFREHQIKGTPTIYVNGYKLPKQYDIADLEYFIDDIKQLIMERKRQEACNCKN